MTSENYNALVSRWADRINDEKFHPWFDRCIGSWVSQRRYLFLKPDGTFAQGDYETHFEISKHVWTDGKENHNVESDGYKVVWTGKTEGEMVLFPRGAEMHRSRGYFSDEPTTSCLTMVDVDTVAFDTSYSGQRFREEVRLIDEDRYRLRQTVGFDLDSGAMTLCGQYLETRLSES